MTDVSSPVLASVVGLTPGAVGGCLNCLVGHPMDLVKVRQQTATVARSTALQTLSRIATRQGVSGLYAGVTAPLVAVVPAFAVTFYSFDLAVAYQGAKKREELDLWQVAKAGAFSGLPLALTIGPLERFKCLMQVQKYPSLAACVRSVYETEGVRGLFRGTAATVCRDVPGNAAYFVAYEFFRRTLSSTDESNRVTTTLLAGGLAGMFNWIVAIPFDVIKSKYQTAPVGQYRGMLHVWTETLRTPAALFRGLSPALLRAFPANAACLLGVETVHRCLDRDR